MGKSNRYKTYKNGKYIGAFCAKELKEMIGISVPTLYCYAENGHCYKKCYTFERYTSYTQEDLEVMWQWDKYRKILNPNAAK